MATRPLAVTRFRILFTAWWILWTSLQAGVLFWLDFDLMSSITDSVVTNSLLAATCVLVTKNLRYYLPREERYWYLFLLSVALSSVWLAACRWIMLYLFETSPAYLDFFQRSLPVRFCLAFLMVACMAMISVVWYTSEEQKENEKRKSEADALSREAELFKLRQQLQPHFLFNSLNSISALIASSPEQARAMIQHLSDFLRGTLKKEEQQWVDLAEELQYLELYLSIEKIRFGHRLDTVIASDETSRSLKLPNMLLQPIVENAIKFGLYDTIGKITISIEARVSDSQLEICVRNPFDPESAPVLHGTGFGLNSVQRRLQLLFARNDLLSTETQGNLFITKVKIPQPL